MASPPNSPLSPLLSAPVPPPLLLLPPSTAVEQSDLSNALNSTVSSDMPSGVLLTTVVPETAGHRRKGQFGGNEALDVFVREEERRVAFDEKELGESEKELGEGEGVGNCEDDADTPNGSTGISDVTVASSLAEGCCERCRMLEAENDDLSRQVARLRLRLKEAMETAHTHGQRLLRAAYQDKIRQLTEEHMRKTTDMLNKQKKCFEEELEALDGEAQTALGAMQRERDAERAERVMAEERWKREREAALEKTSATMGAVQRKLGQMHAKVTRLEREKKSLSKAVQEKQTMIEVLASAAAARDVERRRMEMMEKNWENERLRKDSLVEALQAEVAELRERLGRERRGNDDLRGRLEQREREWGGERNRYREEVEGCRREGRGEVERLGRLLGSVMQDYANNASNISTND